MIPFWLNDPSVLLQYPDVFFPSSYMSTNRLLNSLVRLTFYASTALVVFGKPDQGICLFVATALITVFCHHFLSDRPARPEDAARKLKQPTQHNPFMNVTFDDYSNPSATQTPSLFCAGVENTAVQDDMQRAANCNVDDSIFGRHGGAQREFYTMPVTTVPNNQIQLAKWLYREEDGNTCKEGNQSVCTSRTISSYNNRLY